MIKRLFALIQYPLPQHLLSRLAGRLADSRIRWLKNLLIRAFVRAYRVNMDEALYPEVEDYPSFNAFFTRPLKDDARPLAADPAAVLSPADGVLSAIGRIDHDRLFQAKGRDFSLQELLGGDEARAAPFQGGEFATIYLSPQDYHRVHMPYSGTLKEMVFIPGRLFSVNQATTNHVPRLFARNERVACFFETDLGPMAVVLVGAMIVASIDTVWAGRVAPGNRRVGVSDYSERQPPVHLVRGMEMGRFRLGSTVVMLFPPGTMGWSEQMAKRGKVMMGQQMGTTRRS